MSDGYYQQLDDDEVERICNEYGLEYHDEGWASDRWHAFGHILRYYGDGDVDDLVERICEEEMWVSASRLRIRYEYERVMVYPAELDCKRAVDFATGEYRGEYGFEEMYCESCGGVKRLPDASMCEECWVVERHDMPGSARRDLRQSAGDCG